MKTLIKHANQKSRIPVLNTIKVQNGMATAFDLGNQISYPCDKQDGLYDAKGVKAGVWLKSEIPMEDFPELLNMGEKVGQCTVEIDDLDYVSRAMSMEEVRYYLNGIHFDGHGIVATDGHRLHMVKNDTGLQRGNLILPRASVNYILAMAKEQKTKELIIIEFTENKFKTKVGAYEIAGALIDGTFPDYNRVIPKDHSKIGVYSLPELKAIEKEAKALHKANGGKHGATMKFEGNKMRVMAREYSKSWDTALNFGPEGIGFNLDYLIDIGLDGADALTSPKYAHEPVRFDLGNRIAVLMPIRV